MSPLELVRDAETLAEMSLGDTLIAGVQIAIVGMIVVFSILFILMISIKIMEKLANSNGKVPGEKVGDKSMSSLGKKETKKKKISDDKLDPEILAVISASIQSYYGSDKKFRILRVKGQGEELSAWGQQARGGHRK
ncbi:MAG: OadG family protein [Halarsenatibacteraceae bacterium]